MYIADTYNNRIRKVTVSTGIITTYSGSSTSNGFSGDNGPATSATMYAPTDISLDSAGISYINLVIAVSRLTYLLVHLGNVYIADYSNNRIRKVTISTGIITTYAGSSTSGSYSGDNGPATSAGLAYPYGIALDSAGISLCNSLFPSCFNSFFPST